VLSVALCYSSFMTADIPVKITNTQNRTEPVPVFDFKSSQHTYPGLREMLGQQRGSSSLTDRSVLRLDHLRDSWLANNTEYPVMEPYIRNFGNMGENMEEVGSNVGNYNCVPVRSANSYCRTRSFLACT
jgi:hypothetical protein